MNLQKLSKDPAQEAMKEANDSVLQEDESEEDEE